MPTIDQLPVVSAVTDDDELLLSQNGHIHKATRAQVLAGVQTQLALTQGQLLGRASAGAGAPEAVMIGANLALSGGVLSASAPPLNLAALPAGVAPGVADVAVLGQGGRLVSVPYTAYVAGIANVAGLNGSALTVSVNGTPDARTLAAIAGDTVPVEAFGAAGDGVTDDSAAIAAAVASGRPVRFGPRTYMVNGQWTIVQAGAVLLGVPGATVLRRGSQTGNGAWIAVQADRFTAEGIIFDANKSAVGVNSWGVLVTNVCATSRFDRCAFLRA